jgi:DNA polymerase/3'-5' exonuclease PolX
MTSQGSRTPIEKALPLAKKFLGLLQPFITKAEIAGSVRREVRMVGDIEVVCIENPFNAIDNFIHKGYPGLKVNGPRLKRLIFEGVQIDLFITSPHDYGRILAIRTGSSTFSHKRLAVRWREIGWCGTKDGLRKIDECDRTKSRWELKPENKGKETIPPIFETEYDFFDFLNIPWVPPSERNL